MRPSRPALRAGSAAAEPGTRGAAAATRRRRRWSTTAASVGTSAPRASQRASSGLDERRARRPGARRRRSRRARGRSAAGRSPSAALPPRRRRRQRRHRRGRRRASGLAGRRSRRAARIANDTSASSASAMGNVAAGRRSAARRQPAPLGVVVDHVARRLGAPPRRAGGSVGRCAASGSSFGVYGVRSSSKSSRFRGMAVSNASSLRLPGRRRPHARARRARPGR